MATVDETDTSRTQCSAALQDAATATSGPPTAQNIGQQARPIFVTTRPCVPGPTLFLRLMSYWYRTGNEVASVARRHPVQLRILAFPVMIDRWDPTGIKYTAG